jgi:hypothetical protein
VGASVTGKCGVYVCGCTRVISGLRLLAIDRVFLKIYKPSKKRNIDFLQCFNIFEIENRNKNSCIIKVCKISMFGK